MSQTLAPSPPAAQQVRTCRACGCTDDDCRQCVARTGQPCHWVAADMCSACTVDPLEALVDKVLIETLSNTLKASINRLVARGESYATIIDCVRLAARGKRPLTVLAVEAYLGPLHVQKVSLAQEAEWLNVLCPVGRRCRYWPGVREGPGIESRLRSSWGVLGGHTVVVWIEGQPGCIAASHVEVLP